VRRCDLIGVLRDRFDHLAAIALKAAIMVMQVYFVDLTQHQIKDPTWQYLMPGIEAPIGCEVREILSFLKAKTG
jgi:hypothetical protein